MFPAGLPTSGFGGALGFAATGGGLGLFAIGGGGLAAMELEGRELGGVLFDEPLLVAAGVFFQGVADPLAGAIPGKTDTGLADESAAMGLTGILGEDTARVVDAAAGIEGGGRRLGGSGAATALGFEGTSSR